MVICFCRLQEDPPTGVSGAPTDNNIMIWNAVIFGPHDTPFEDGTFKLTIEFTEEYPNKPPTVRSVIVKFLQLFSGYVFQRWLVWCTRLLVFCFCLQNNEIVVVMTSSIIATSNAKQWVHRANFFIAATHTCCHFCCNTFYSCLWFYYYKQLQVLTNTFFLIFVIFLNCHWLDRYNWGYAMQSERNRDSYEKDSTVVKWVAMEWHLSPLLT